MADAVLLESINREQLATATDRLLFGGRAARQRLAEGSQVAIVVSAVSRRLAHGTGVFAVGHAPKARARKHAPVVLSKLARPAMVYARRPFDGHRAPDRTMAIRRRKSAQFVGLAVVVPAVVGLAIGLAALI